jgi:hypothetical protein
VRRLDLQRSAGVFRIAWNLRGEPPAGGRGGGRGGAFVPPQAEDNERSGANGGAPSEEEQDEPPPAFGGRGGAPQGPAVGAGRYKATIGKMVGDVVTPIGEPQWFQVVPLPR